MPGPTWDTDNPADAGRITANADALVKSLMTAAAARALPTVADVVSWHTDLYAGCDGPCAGYVGNFRGDPAVAELVGYEIGVGRLQADGYPERMGVLSADVGQAVTNLLAQIHLVVATLDTHLATGVRPATVEELHSVVGLAARIHGEWVRIHPFANGNGRTARVWAAWLALRYGLPVFVSLKPRPGDVAYAVAARASMGRPPAFVGNHAPSELVFTHMLALHLLV